MDSTHTELVFNLPEINFSTHIIQANPEALFVAVIYSHENNAEYLEQMNAIFKSIGIDGKNDVQIVEMQKNQSHFRVMELCPSSRNFFFFGMNAQEAGLTLPYSLYRIIAVGQQQFLFADAFSVLHHNVEAKKKLWFCLKAHYLKE